VHACTVRACVCVC